MNNRTGDLFGPPISVYTDADALADGVLVSISGESDVNRVTRAVFNHFVGSDHGSAETEDLTDLMAAIRAMRAVPPNKGWRCATYQDQELWLIPNEVGGLTLMFPGDY